MAIVVPKPAREPRLIGSPTVTWFELFYDLVVVAAVSLTNDVFLARPTAGTAVTAAICMTALAWVWFLTTLFNNLFPGQDILRRLLLVLQMGAIVVAGLAADQDHGITNRAGLVAYGIALVIVAVLIVSGGRRAGGPVPRATVLALALAAAICCLGGLDANLHSGYYLVAALVVSMVPILLRQYSQWRDHSQLRLDHLRERLGLFVLIILGEGFAQLVSALHAMGSIPRGDLFALMFLMSFALWWIYFDGTFSRHTDLTTVRWRLTLLAHLTLVFGIAGTLDILILLTSAEASELGDEALAYFVACLATVLLSFAAIGYTARGRVSIAGWVQVGSALLVLVVGLLLVSSDDEVMYAVIALASAVVVGNAILAVWADEAGTRRRWSSTLRPALLGENPEQDIPDETWSV